MLNILKIHTFTIFSESKPYPKEKFDLSILFISSKIYPTAPAIIIMYLSFLFLKKFKI